MNLLSISFHRATDTEINEVKEYFLNLTFEQYRNEIEHFMRNCSPEQYKGFVEFHKFIEAEEKIEKYYNKLRDIYKNL